MGITGSVTLGGNVADIVTAGELLTIRADWCLDRVYLNAYVPTLQSSGLLVAS